MLQQGGDRGGYGGGGGGRGFGGGGGYGQGGGGYGGGGFGGGGGGGRGGACVSSSHKWPSSSNAGLSICLGRRFTLV